MSAERNTRIIKNIGTLVTGDLDNPVRQADSVYIADGLICEIGHGLTHQAEVVIDARRPTAIPGLIDSHSHPTFGEFTPAQEAFAWITHYLHGGVTALISAGELHLPGPLMPPDPITALALALLAKRCYDQLRPSGVKVYASTLLLVPGLKEEDFAAIAAAGIRVKIHSGGVSRSGVSQVAGAAIVKDLRPDIVGHFTGGPIPMPEGDVAAIVAETEFFLEICSSGNPRMALPLMDLVKARAPSSASSSAPWRWESPLTSCGSIVSRDRCQGCPGFIWPGRPSGYLPGHDRRRDPGGGAKPADPAAGAHGIDHRMNS